MKASHTPGPWYQDKYGSLLHGNEEHVLFRGVAVACSGSMVSEAEANTKLIAAAPDLLEALKQALRYIEVKTAYQGAMTADQVEEAIKDKYFPSSIGIGANSCNTLATFSFDKARAAIAKATE